MNRLSERHEMLREHPMSAKTKQGDYTRGGPGKPVGPCTR